MLISLSSISFKPVFSPSCPACEAGVCLRHIPAHSPATCSVVTISTIRRFKTRCIGMQQVFQAATSRPLSPVSTLNAWLDPIASLYPKFLYEALDEATVLAPARQVIII